ncbi:MAG: prenyltransferase/squalene oxidase repeat-containing protein [Planctomycetota bacterium]|nr:prenyltransferase/squalene oxidase repeat-containing protein [Planctomycetota bacterium]
MFKRCLSLTMILWLGGCSASLPPPPLDTVGQLLDRACLYLWSKQGDDGGWHSETHGLLRSGQALTPFVLHALLEAEPQMTEQHRDKVQRALDFIRSSVNSDGVVGLGDPDVAEYPNYASSFAVRCLVAAGGQQDTDLIELMCRYLKSQQFSDDRGFDRDHPVHGAWGFGGPLPLGGSPGHVDISYTRHVLEALRDANAIDEGLASRARLFLNRMQREGGFYFSPVVGAANKGKTVLSEDGEGTIYLPYATATSEGLLALLAAGVKLDDRRVVGALAWLESHPDLDHPGGIPRDHPEQWGQVLFFYHLAIRGEVAIASGKSDHMLEPLATLLIDRQGVDGSFVNPHGTLMKEDDPILATALAIKSLGAALSR